MTIDIGDLLVADADVGAVPERLLRPASGSHLVRRDAVLSPEVRILTTLTEIDTSVANLIKPLQA